VALLRPHFIKLDAAALVDLVDSSGPIFDFGRLKVASDTAHAIGATPLVSLRNPPEWGLDAHAYAVFVTGAAKALNQKGSKPVRYFDLATYDENGEAGAAIHYYNTAYAALKGLSKNFRVGGIGEDSTDGAGLAAVLKGAAGLDFFSVSFYGTDNGQSSDEQVLRAARDITALKESAGLLDKSRFARVPLYVTAANLSSAHELGDVVPADARLVQGISATWWAQFMASGSRVADQIFFSDSVNPEWGLLDANAHAYPAYYAAWLWNTYFSDAQRVASSSDNAQVYVAACNTATAHNMMLINDSDEEQVARIAIRGFPVLHEARLRLFDDPTKSVSFATLPKSPYQTVTIAPHAVAVLQFIEPPKKH
jgi:hypothetical protein